MLPLTIPSFSQIQATLQSCLQATPVQAIYVFGSQANGHAAAHSDVDLAVLCAGKPDPILLWRSAQELAIQLNIEVDLIDLRSASTVLQYQIVQQGQRLWLAANSRLMADLFETFVLSEYTDFNQARAGLLHEIALTGKIYAR